PRFRRGLVDGASSQSLPAVSIFLPSAVGADRAGRDLYRPFFHISATGVMAMKSIVKMVATGVVVLAALGMIAYKYFDYIEYPWTRNGLVRAQVIQIVPRVSGELTRVPIRNNQLVKKGDLLFEIDPRTFQDQVNFASAQLANMKDVVQSLAQQVQGMRDLVKQ